MGPAWTVAAVVSSACGMATKEDDEVMFLFSARSHDTVLFFSNLGKVFWPDEGYTKGDLVEYYRVVGPALLLSLIHI